MLKVISVTVGPEKYGTDIVTVVKFQIGDRGYNTTEITLDPAVTRKIIDLAVINAASHVAAISSEVKIAGEMPEVPMTDAEAFLEVDEPAPVPTPTPETETEVQF